MNRESRLLVDLWNLAGEQFPKSQRIDAVISILRIFQEFGIEPEEFEEATEEDLYIHHGFNAIVEPEDNYNDDDEEGDY